MNNFAYSQSSFDAVIAIDTLYFADITSVLVNSLSSMTPKGKMALLYTQVVAPNASADDLLPQNTLMGKSLSQLNLKYDTIEFTNDILDFVKLTRKIADELKNDFKTEGNDSLYNDIVKNYDEVTQWFESKSLSRYLYRINYEG